MLRILTVLLYLFSANAWSTPVDVKIGDPLREVLDRYSAAGLNVISTSGTLPPRLRVTKLPDFTAPLLTQIRTLLEPHGLTIVLVDDANGYVAEQSAPVSDIAAVAPVPEPREDPQLEEILVTSHYRVRRQTQQKFSVDQHDLQATPSLGRDALRSLEALPGISSNGVSARHQFRGGDANEVLYLLDGIELLEPFHLPNVQDLFSAVNLNIVDSADVYVAGFPVTMGSRMSGVVDLELIEPQKPLAGHVDVNLITAAADISGYQGDWSWLASARHSVVDKALQLFETDYGSPRFHDEYARLVHTTASHTISVNLLNNRDRVTLNDSDESGRGNNNYQAAWLRWEQRHSPRLLSSWSLNHILIENSRRGEVEIPEFSTGNLLENRDFTQIEFSNRWQWQATDTWAVDAGWSAAHQSADFATSFAARYGTLALPIQQQENTSRIIDVDREGESTQAFVSLQVAATDTIEIEAGVRYDGQDIDPVHVNELSSRVNVSWQVTPRFLFAANIGRYTQQQHLYEIQIDNGKAELDDPQHSDQINLTSIWSPRRAMRIRLDLFQRQVDNPWSHFENLYNRWALFPELQGDRFEVAPSRVRTEGLELTFTHAPGNHWTWHAHYGYIRAREKYLGRMRDRPWAQQHSVKAGFRWRNEHWRAGMSVSYHSGWPTTRFIQTPDDLSTSAFGSRLPAFLSVDAHVSRQFNLARGNLDLYLDVTNLTGRDNVGGYDYVSPIKRDPKSLLPIIPIVGVIWRW